ncbi:MAG: RluA family pseudouridine synthase [Alphaproteobacteria bacterium]|nr:RluA family pseudouridine synthase [Alphaproteobacteria bacterium]
MDKKVYTITAESNDAGERLDKWLTSRVPELSRSRVQALMEQGHITCDGATIVDSAAKVKPSQAFTITIPELLPSYITAQEMPLDIIYEDEHLLVLNKPAGMTVHPAPGHADGTLVNALLAHCGESLSGIGGVVRPGIVHRIDKDTSGLLVVAKNDTAHAHLSAQLSTRTLGRTYSALVWGVPKKLSGTITGNIGRSPSNRQKQAVLKTGGKEATTHYRVVSSEQWTVNSKQENKSLLNTDHRPLSTLFSLIECKLETGRTHQIRVHCAHIGHPLVGDQTYGAATGSRLNAGGYKALTDQARAALLAFDRQALHARELHLIHPHTGEEMHFECPLPEDMVGLIEALKRDDG